MTFEKAVKILKANEERRLASEYVRIKNLAIKTFKKQIPKKVVAFKTNRPIRLGNGTFGKGTTVYKCPCCMQFVSRINKYCGECGQALDWSDNNAE